MHDDTPAPPRIPPLRTDERTDEQSRLLEGVGGPDALNIFATLARHPKLFRRWLPFGGALLFTGTLAPRDRELVILRTAWRCGCAYEWGQHVAFARDAGLSDDEIRRLAVDALDGWPDADTAVLGAVDELLSGHRITEPTWQALAARFDESQLVELPLLAGHYAMLAGALNSFGVPPDGPLPALGEVS
jgi:4-carboxymuconolactone decarboxylase